METIATRESPAIALIDSQPINIATQSELLDKIMNRVKSGFGFTLFTLNMDHLVKRRDDARFRDAYRRATFVTADGAPVVALARRQGAKLERTTGADLLVPLCAAAERDGVPVYFFGSSEEALAKASAKLRKMYPALDIRGLVSPPMGFDPTSPRADRYGQRIRLSGAKLCFVLLGAPKQELFSDRMMQICPEVGFLCVGAALDFVAGEQKRAPSLLQKTGLEWAWRLATNPRRLLVRYAKCAALLADLALLQPRVPRAASVGPRS